MLAKQTKKTRKKEKKLGKREEGSKLQLCGWLMNYILKLLDIKRMTEERLEWVELVQSHSMPQRGFFLSLETGC